MSAMCRWFIYNYFGQIAHTHTQKNITPKHKTHARMRTQHQNKQNKESYGCQSRKPTESRRIMVLKCFTIFSSFQEELAWGFS